MQKLPRYTQSHGVLVMNTWLKVICLHKFAKRTRAKLSNTTENFKISQLEDELELPKVQQKSENYMSQTDHSF
jgi:hypothetical protein